VGLFSWRKKHVAAEIAGHNITVLVLDADDCWRDVCALRSYKTTGPVATCEMAFARAGLIRSIFSKHKSRAVAERMLKSSSACVIDSFTDEDNDDTLRFYGSKMAVVGPSIVALYEENIFPSSQWASLLGGRLGVPGVWSSEIAPMVEHQEQRILKLLGDINIV